MYTQTVAYDLRQGGTTTAESTNHTQRWPCTRTNAARVALLDLYGGAVPVPGTRAYTWIRVEPPVPPI